MPQKDEVSSLSQGLILLDKKALLEHKIGLVFPQDVPESGSIRVVKREIMNKKIVQQSTSDESEENSSLVKETPGMATNAILFCMLIFKKSLIWLNPLGTS